MEGAERSLGAVSDIGLHEKDDAVEIATIQSILGTKRRRVLKTLPNVPAIIKERTVAGILTALETFCILRKNNLRTVCFQNDNAGRSYNRCICCRS